MRPLPILSFSLYTAFLLPVNIFGAQICIQGSDVGELDYGPFANRLFKKCGKGDNLKKGFSNADKDTGGTWYAKWTGCSDEDLKCDDLFGWEDYGGNGGDYKNLVDSCRDGTDATKGVNLETFPYVLTASHDKKFHGGAFEHIIRKTNKPCGALIVAPGKDTGAFLSH